MLYKYTWTPSFKGTHSLITDLTLWELWLTWASEILLQVTPPGFKLTCVDQRETNRRDSGLLSKVTLVPNLSYLFCRNTMYSKSSFFPTQLWHVYILSYSYQRTMTPSGDQIFLLATTNTKTGIILPKNYWKYRQPYIDSKSCLLWLTKCLECVKWKIIK